MKLELRQNNKRVITLFEMDIESKTEAELMVSHIILATRFASDNEILHGKILTLYLDDKEVIPDTINCIDGLKGFIDNEC